MTTDSERREVARRLRENAKYVSKYDDIDCVLNDILRGEEKRRGVNENCTACRSATFVELADLIEPHEPHCIANVTIDGEELERVANKAVKEAIGIDRDALLELADRLSGMGEDDGVCGYFGVSCGGCAECPAADEPCIKAMAHDISRRIREALGAVDG